MRIHDPDLKRSFLPPESKIFRMNVCEMELYEVCKHHNVHKKLAKIGCFNIYWLRVLYKTLAMVYY